MCSTTTEKRPAADAQVQRIQPNQAGGPGGSTTPAGPAGPLPFDGVPENVPTLTFIVQARVTPDGFIDPANTYHRNCGLNPSTITSIENLLVQLAASTTRIPRMRIVTHAHPQALAAAMFEGSNVFQVNEEWLVGFAESDEAGLRAILALRHFFNWRLAAIRTHLAGLTPNPLAPFGTNPRPALDEVLRWGADLALVNLGFVTRGSAALTAAQRTTLRNVITFIAHAVAAPLLTGGVNPGHVDAVLTAVGAMTLADLQVQNVTHSFGTGSFDQFAVAARALAAIQNNFRTNLEKARARLDENSFIDIRGCRAGDTESYLRALQAFFGRPGHRPAVSGPRWFQYLGRCPAPNRPANNAQIHTLLTTGAHADEIRAGFDDWARRTRVDPTHTDFWRNLLTGNAVAFCQLAWRERIPPLHRPLQMPGLASFSTLSFRDTIARIVDLFRVAPANVPSAAVLTTLDTFLTSKLNGWTAHLLAVVNTTTPGAQLSTLFGQLKAINDDLGQTIVPATPPATLTAADITGYQTALVEFLEANQLAPVRQFMNAVKARIDDTADPGVRYYMLQIGLPVFIFAFTEREVAGHAINMARNRLVVLRGATEDAAYRQWPPLLWAQELPAGNRFGTIRVTDADACHIQMMVESSEVGDTRVAVCPHPDYMDKIRTVR